MHTEDKNRTLRCIAEALDSLAVARPTGDARKEALIIEAIHLLAETYKLVAHT